MGKYFDAISFQTAIRLFKTACYRNRCDNLRNLPGRVPFSARKRTGRGKTAAGCASLLPFLMAQLCLNS